MRALLTPVAIAVLVGGCGDATTTASSTAYGPLFVPASEATHPRAGAAGEIVDCRTWGRGGFEDAQVYAEGATADSPTAALQTARSEGGYGGVQDGLREAARTEDRVLYVVEVDGVVKQAVIVHDGQGTEGAGGDGWYVESWAMCDAAELPATYAASIGLGVWSDTDGPAPTSQVASWRGPEHCDWQTMTFLEVHDRTYVRDPLPGLRDWVLAPYRTDVRVPDAAEDTGWHREGAHLWLTDTAAYVGTRDRAEAWPRAKDTLGCD